MELIPLHQGTNSGSAAAHSFPCTLGRRELASWWWDTCPCRRNASKYEDNTVYSTALEQNKNDDKRPCRRCRRVGQNVTSLSKRLLQIDVDGRVCFLTHKNRNLVHVNNHACDWWNEEKSHTEAALSLQVGDVISIGTEPEPWMEFQVQQVVSSMTNLPPHASKKTRVVTPGTEIVSRLPKKRHAKQDSSEGARSSPKRRLQFTNSFKKRGEQECSAYELPVRKRVIVPETPPEEESRLGNELAIDSDEDSCSVVSSMLSLPQCPSSASQTQEAYSQSQTIQAHLDMTRSTSRGQLTSPAGHRLLNSNSSMTPRSQDEEGLGGRDETIVSGSSLQTIPAAALSMVDWKKMTARPIHATGGMSKVRSAIAALVVIQRQRLKDPAWLPGLIQDSAVAQGETMGS